MTKPKPMRWDTREPCESCPYRVDSKLELWHPQEFKTLLANNANEIMGRIYGCHGTKKSLEGPQICGGWLFDQKRRNLPAIQLRIALARNPKAVTALEEVNDGGHELYESILEMCEENGVTP